MRIAPVTYVAAAVAFSLALPSAARAEDPKPPKADDIIAKHVEAVGGKAALEKIKTAQMKGTLDLPQLGKQAITAFLAAPDKSYTKVELGERALERGCNGAAAWEMNPMTGPRKLDAEEAEEYRRNSIFDQWVRWKDLYDGVEAVEAAKVDDKPAWKVVLKTKPAKGTATFYFDQASGLLVKQDRSRKNPMGGDPMPIEVFSSDFKKVGDVLVSHKTVLKFSLGGQKIEQTTEWESIKHNVEIPKDRFDVPQEIKNLKETNEEK